MEQFFRFISLIIELVLNMLAEVTATSISKQEQPQSFEENKNIAVRGGKVANTAKKEYEKATGLKAVSSLNAKDKKALEIQNDKKE